MNFILAEKYRTPVILLLLTAGALLVHGYHPYAEDAEIYLPGVERILHPGLFPAGQEFFASHAGLTIFPNLIAFSLRVTHLPMETGLFLWHVASVFLLLLACWELSSLLFPSAKAQWGGVGLVAALLTIPVAGTALYIMDQYLNPRNLAAFAAIFAVARILEKKYLRAALWLAFAGSVHPLMAAFAFSFCFLLLIAERFQRRTAAPAAQSSLTVAGLLVFGISLDPPTSPAYHAAAMRHQFHYIQLWRWYEQLGILAPVVLFWWFARIARERQWQRLELVCRALVVYDLVYFFAALVVDLPVRFESLARLQPLRSLHLLYMLMFLIMGGLLGEFVLKNRVWRWLTLFVPLGVGMFIAQRDLFPASAHIEWPGVAPKNEWAQAFVWVRDNTPVDAVFGLDPDFMQLPGEDTIGFRCLAERSRLADLSKDSGAVSMFPPLAEDWWTEVQAQTPWKSFHAEDFLRLRNRYGVNWVVVQQPGVAGLDCAYQNAAVRVCRIPQQQ
ncbi:MAG TPA: hypothetical protein VK930_04525 [Verrucomicrobiae bacterium]|nr:hypothetical protein [Verrucomicrobiae bacterium]